MILTRQSAHCIKLMGDNFLLKNTRVQHRSIQILADTFANDCYTQFEAINSCKSVTNSKKTTVTLYVDRKVFLEFSVKGTIDNMVVSVDNMYTDISVSSVVAEVLSMIHLDINREYNLLLLYYFSVLFKENISYTTVLKHLEEEIDVDIPRLLERYDIAKVYYDCLSHEIKMLTFTGDADEPYRSIKENIIEPLQKQLLS